MDSMMKKMFLNFYAMLIINNNNNKNKIKKFFCDLMLLLW